LAPFLPAGDAAKILLVRAIEETQPARALAPEADAAASAEDAHGEADWVLRRAAHRLDHDLAGYRTLLPLAAAPHAPGIVLAIPFLAGALANSFGPAAQIHVLYNPIAVLVAWNLALYLALAIAPFAWRARAKRIGAPAPVAKRAATPAREVRPDGARGWMLRSLIPSFFLRLHRGARETAAAASQSGAVARRFWSLWIEAAGALPAAGLRRWLHASAAALAVGAVAGMFVRGVFFEYAMVWRSTFVRDPETVATLLGLALGPARLVLGEALPDAAEATRMMSAEGVPAAEWIGAWAVTAGLFVVAPRVVLAVVATLRRRLRARRIPLHFEDAYFEQLLAGVHRVQIERIETAIGEDVRGAAAQLAESIAAFVCTHLYDERLVPALNGYREKGGSVAALESEMEAACESFQPALDAELARARADFETSLRLAIERTLGQDFGLGESAVAVRAGELPVGLGGAVGREISNAVGAAVSTGVGLVVATLSGGFGHHLGAAILVALLHTTGPVGFLIGGIGGLVVAGAGWYLGRDRMAREMRGLQLPRWLARLALRERALQKLVADGREQCRTAVRDRLGAELEPLVPELAEQIWAKLRPALPVAALQPAPEDGGTP
jgi:hypothetical protein